MEVADSVGSSSLLPPLAAIVLAVWSRHVVLSLFVGLWLGVTMLSGWNPIIGIYALVVDFAWVQVTNPWNVMVIVLMLCIGGFVELVVRSGAAEAFAIAMCRVVTNRVRAQGAVWFSGIVVFFSDSANPLILGPLFGPLFDRLKLSREKLAYLIDSTASPICILVPITSWAAYVLSLLSREFADLPAGETPMTTYLQSIPLQFYAIASLLLVPLIGLLRLEYGPMRKAEQRAMLASVAAKEQVAASSSTAAPEAGTDSRTAVGGAVALATVAVVILGTLLWTGGFPDVGVLTAIARGKSVIAVTLGFVAGAIVLAGLLLKQRAMKADALLKHWGKGAIGMREVLVILVLAWSLGACCDALGTGIYVASVVERVVSPVLVPALVFLAGAVISFATGSAWGCYAIMMPIALPLAIQAGLPVHVVLAAVLSGGILGDHASPISDTTILASMGAGCEHVEHVRTQLPYAATAAIAALAGFLLAGVWPTAWALLPALALLVVLALAQNWLAGKTARPLS